ncbi:MAG: serine/threonine-protein kinase [Archangium sp.]
MNFLCPSCRTPLPRAAPTEAVTCTGCGVAVDLTRVETAPGQARLWPEVDLSGESLGGYRLQKLIGSGGMGTVYDALSTDGSRVAVKVLAPLLAAEPALRERFRREAHALEALHHPGVVRMLADGEDRSFCWYAMEHVDGVDLRKRLESGPLSEEEAVTLAKTMLDALELVHARGFVHRDVKPSNILLSSTGPKLCDFGVARLDGANTLTESAAVLGSLRYMAPEQRWGKTDARSDLYSLGVVLHEALARGVPGEKPLPSTSLNRLITKLTAQSPDERPASATTAKALLKRSRALVIVSFVAVLGIVAAGAWSMHPQPPPILVVEPFDAGVEAIDAGPPDAGEEVVDAGIEVPDAGPPPPVKPPPKGKIVKPSPIKSPVKKSKKLIDSP